MEEYYKSSDRFTSQYNPRNTSKFTGKISKRTSKFTGETELGQGGAGALGSRDNLSIPCPSWACGLPAPGTTCRVAPRQLIWGLAQGPSPVLEPILRPIGHWPKAHGTPRGLGVSVLFVRLRRQRRQKGKETATPLRLSPMSPTFLGYWESCQMILLLCRSCY
jgi:hypothetical protein